MLTRASKIIILVLCVAISASLFWLNPEKLTVNYFWGIVSAPAGIILLAVFILGVAVASLFGLVLGFKSLLRENRLREMARKRELAYEAVTKARSAQVLFDNDRAVAAWSSIISKYPADILARLELAKVLEQQGDFKEALRVLDAARAIEPGNQEVFWRAAELNIKIGNKTAALDNLALLIHNQPTQLALLKARNLSEELGRLEDAEEYQRMLEKLGDDDLGESFKVRIKLKTLCSEFAQQPDLLAQELRRIIKDRPAFLPVMLKLSELYVQFAQTEEAAKLLLKASRISPTNEHWLSAVNLWLQAKQPERAIASAKAAISEIEKANHRGDRSISDLVTARLELAKLYLTLTMSGEAQRELDNISELITANPTQIGIETKRMNLILKGRLFSLTGKVRELTDIFEQLSEGRFESGIHKYANLSNQEAPSPILSTP